MNERNTALIRALNDQLRRTRSGGRIVTTRGVASLGTSFTELALRTIAQFDAFTTDDDPYGEHDFGKVIVTGETLLWKIDYYDLSMTCGAENPAIAYTCVRVLTVMLAEEY